MACEVLRCQARARLIPSVDAFRLESVLQERLQSGTPVVTVDRTFVRRFAVSLR
jgi:hypothetical protein